MTTPAPHRSLVLVLAALVAGCGPTFSADVCVVDEAGAPVVGASVVVDGRARTTNQNGRVTVPRLDHPSVAVVDATGMIEVPIVLGPDPGCVAVRMLSDGGGTRRVLHFGGDVMMGRRYQNPEEGEPLMVVGDGGASARAVVSDLAKTFALADAAMVNLETVVGDLPEDEAYPAKRWLLQTPPDALAALDALGVDVAVLGNNHQRDWLEPGVASTMSYVPTDQRVSVGGGLTEAEAGEPRLLDVGGLVVGVLSWTSVDGSYVNDHYPTSEDVPPDDLDTAEAWAWESRVWGLEAYGIEVTSRRLGDVWELLDGLLEDEDPEVAAEIWESAWAVYPELQDWVARYGHGGAAFWDDVASPAAVAELDLLTDVTVVQLHMGMQFATAPSGNARDAAYAAIDAGADIVIGHHPHVIQGVEWYKGKLIAWSLGNLVFDQDFHSTFPTGYLRTVWDDDGSLVQASLAPIWLDAYRPVPLADDAARAVLRTAWERSVAIATAERGSDDIPRAVGHEPIEGAQGTGMIWQGGSAILTEGPGVPESALLVPIADGLGRVPPVGLVRRRLADVAPAGVWVGWEALGTGTFEDLDADEDAGDVRAWTWSSGDVRLQDLEPYGGFQAIELVRGPDNEEVVQARTTARINLNPHRLYADADGAVALDGEATFSVVLSAWASGELDRGSVRLTMYHFDDTDPTAEPESVYLRDVDLPFVLDKPRAWSRVELELPPGALDPVDGLSANAALVYVRVSPPEATTTAVRFDDVSVVEWRPADEEPEGYAAIDWIRAPGVSGMLTVSYLPW
jgi:poly-gamma-glutamate capsule biosynthesis protein CapA/YwtB (metallophosphatase superfamily)